MGVARELHEGELDEWISLGKPYYYIAHQIMVNESNKSSPVRVVYISISYQDVISGYQDVRISGYRDIRN